ncbi:putative phosphate ABC transporter periplasmic phosphate-binding protein [Photobacterium aphoticum]|uniref:Putative phosphate ABC transporter periplasmic phosphate-binding protein n=1 Tax=Photobacterium aphoticum TaxID=754436 RepID=A0A090R5Y5_9GAMM|nr:putative phosphate ABC transporter periplasmic phosphate-binding protein [Photobacterium aphoticum]
MAVVSRENASGSRFSFEDYMHLTREIDGQVVSGVNHVCWSSIPMVQ